MLVLLAAPCGAVDHIITPKKLVVLDKVVAAGKAKVAFKAWGPTRGECTSPISATFDIAYDAVGGSFDMPAANWSVTAGGAVKYANETAPIGGSVRVSVIKSSAQLGLSTVKLVAKSLGDTSIDISTPPSADTVYVAYTVHDDRGEHYRQCALLPCSHTSIAGGSGYKLTCRDGGADADCVAAGCGLSDLGGTVVDTCTSLEWDKKDGADAVPGSGVPDPSNLHDVDNRYTWAGRCTLDSSKLCQPNAAAEAACKAQTSAADWLEAGCEQCAGAEGSCDANGTIATTTAWDWISQLNATSFAGHMDWRLPTTVGQCAAPTGEAAEWGSITLVDGFINKSGIHPIFGPTVTDQTERYWSASTVVASPGDAWAVSYGNFYGTGGLVSTEKNGEYFVRAVR